MNKVWIGLAFITSVAMAGNGGDAVTGFIPGSLQGTAIFIFSTTSVGSPPSCDTTQRFAISSTDAKYKDTVAAILEAHATGISVSAVGLGTCTVLSNAEDLNYVCVGTIPC
jgi:hypothetical protein